MDPVTRSAARLAALVALPVAVLAGIAVFALFQAGDGDAGPAGGPAPTRPAATGPVEMAAPELSERQQVVCRALMSQLPGDLDGLPQRPVTAGPEQNAAYGDPPVTVACGVPAAEYPPTADLFVLSGVCWYAAEQPDATVWTTVDREVPVALRVPAGYDGPGQQAVPVAGTIVESVRSLDELPTGCTG